jgi:hypothetical protein
MDPNKCLKELRSLLKDCMRQGEEGMDRPQDFFDLSDKIQALDEWLTKGGALPKDWQHGEDKT